MKPWIHAEQAILAGFEGCAEHSGLRSGHSLQVLAASPDQADWIWALVKVDPSQLNATSLHAHIVLPNRVPGSVDTRAKSQGQIRHGFGADAAMDMMAAEHSKPPGKAIRNKGLVHPHLNAL